MTIKLDVVIGTPDLEVDMKYGLESFTGVSDSISLIAESFISGDVIERITANSETRNIMMGTFKSSYGLKFKISPSTKDAEKKFKKVGRETFSELISYFLNESLFIDGYEISEKARILLEDFGAENCEKLINQLRVSAVRKAHSVSIHLDLPITIRYRKSLTERPVLASFDSRTADALTVMKDDNVIEIDACIRRFNVNTGNGRLELIDADHTVPFGFKTRYSEVPRRTKLVYSENLHENNAKNKQEWTYLKIRVITLVSSTGAIVKYLIA